MNAAQAADIFQRWAGDEGYLADPLTHTLPATPGEVALIKNITPGGRAILRTKFVAAVSFNDVAPKVIVLLKRAAPGLKQSKLLPTFVESVPIEYRQGLPTIIGDGGALSTASPIYQVRPVAGIDRYTCGGSISVGNARDAGTMGCLVRNSAGVLLGLSNNHVSGSCSFAEVGLPILAPGVHDVAANSIVPFTIGFHERALPLVAGSPDNVSAGDNLDAALFKIRDESVVTSFQGASYDTPANSAPLIPNATVEKVGRTTGHTTGTVVGALNGAFGIGYNAGHHGFTGRVYFDSLFIVQGTADVFSDNGDSGSLVTSVVGTERRAVGLVVGGMSDSRAPGQKLSLILPIERILSELQVTLVTGHNI